MYKGKEYYIEQTQKYMEKNKLSEKELADELKISLSSLKYFLTGKSSSSEQRGYWYCSRLINKIDNEKEMGANFTKYGLYLLNRDINKIKFIYKLLKTKYDTNKTQYEFYVDEFSIYGGNDSDIIKYFKSYNINLKIGYYGHSSYSNPSDKQSFYIDTSNTTVQDIDNLNHDINNIK